MSSSVNSTGPPPRSGDVGKDNRRFGVVHLEWLDPPFSSGHWNPEIIALAGGRELIGRAGSESRRFGWPELIEADPELILAVPCGFTIAQAERELQLADPTIGLLSVPAARSGRMVLVDGSAYFSRPGPRLETSLRIAAATIDPNRCGDLAAAGSWTRFERFVSQ